MDKKLVELGDKLNAGYITRREFIRRAALITGSMIGASAALQACAPAPAAPATTAPPTAVPPTAAAAAPTAQPAAAAGPKLGGTLISARTSDTSGLDPQTTSLLARIRTQPLVYSNLVRMGYDLSIQPDLAESWETLDDGKRIVFKLRQGVMWHPPVNRELTSDDIKFSYARLQKDSPGKVNFTSIQSVEAVDKYTVAFHLDRPNAGLLAHMADSQWGGIVNKETVEANGDLRKVACGTGPFILEQWVPDTEMKFKKNPSYFIKGRPYLDNVVVRVVPEESQIVAGLRTNSIHHAMLEDNRNYDLIKGEKNLTSYQSLKIGFDHLVINHKREPFDKQQVRLAVSYAIDRNEIIQAATQGHAQLLGPLPASMKLWALPEEKWMPFYKVDLDKAKSLLAEAGLAGGFKTTISLVTGFPTMIAAATVIQANLKRIGIDAEILSFESGAWTPKWQAKDYAMFTNITGGGADPDAVLKRIFHSKAENWVNWQAPDVDKMLEDAAATFDYQKRKALYDQVQMELLNRGAMIWDFCSQMIDFSQNYVKGFRQHPRTNLDALAEAWLEKA